MTNEQLWAPWRLSYVAAAKEQNSGESGCFLCRYRAGNDDLKNLVAVRGKRSLVILNRFPYNNGHLLVAPLEHKGSLEELDDDELLDGLKQLQRLIAVYNKILSPDGFNIGLNLGRAGGAGLPGHLHWHLVPRWQGDTNFMPVLAGVDVIPQSLQALYELLMAELAEDQSP